MFAHNTILVYDSTVIIEKQLLDNCHVCPLNNMHQDDNRNDKSFWVDNTLIYHNHEPSCRLEHSQSWCESMFGPNRQQAPVFHFSVMPPCPSWPKLPLPEKVKSKIEECAK